MTRDEHAVLKIIAKDRFRANLRLAEYLETVEITDEPEKKANRTGQQNRAIHLDCKLIAEKLDAAGLDMRQVLKPTYSLPWTTESVKEHLWKPIMKALYGFTSTTQLPKGEGKIEHIHEVLMRELGKTHGVEWHDFPNDDVRQLEQLTGPMLVQAGEDRGYEYPEEDNDGLTAFD